MPPQALAQDAATLDEMKNQDVPDFTHKLRRVLDGKSRVDAAGACDTKPGTLRGWLSQGTIPPPAQIALLAEYAGCSIAYLCDDRIPSEADPTTSLTDAQLIARLRDRYIEEAERLHDYLDELQGIDWYGIGRRLLDNYAPKLLKGEAPGPFPPDIDRAAEVLTAIDEIIPTTVGPFLLVFSMDSVDGRLRFDALKRRIDAIAYAQTVRVVIDLLPNLRGLAAAARRGSKHDLTGVTRLFDEMRVELDEHAASGAHLLETCAGVLEAGGVDEYAASISELVKVKLAANAKPGHSTPAQQSEAVKEAMTETVTADLARQMAYELKAYKTWMVDVGIKTGTVPDLPDDVDQWLLSRCQQRVTLVSEAVGRRVKAAKN